MGKTNVGRLEQIKRHWSSDIQEEWDCVDGTEITWLIGQAERVQELEGHCKSLTVEWRDGVLENKRLREEVEQLEGELKEWADLIEPTLDV
ncbi:hypothetical protein [Sporosarcina psychrophila]|uniref:Uncharacterized protein n=1 Tax=Sporosarcina psychrophila TaxID=1476 RepID=A0ABV2KBA3_SPOPS